MARNGEIVILMALIFQEFEPQRPYKHASYQKRSVSRVLRVFSDGPTDRPTDRQTDRANKKVYLKRLCAGPVAIILYATYYVQILSIFLSCMNDHFLSKEFEL